MHEKLEQIDGIAISISENLSRNPPIIYRAENSNQVAYRSRIHDRVHIVALEGILIKTPFNLKRTYPHPHA